MSDLAQIGVSYASNGVETLISSAGQVARALGNAESATQKMARELEALQKTFQSVNTGSVNTLVQSIERINGAVKNMSIGGSTAGLDTFISKLAQLGDGSARATGMVASASRAIQGIKEAYVGLNTANVGQFNASLNNLEQMLTRIAASSRHSFSGSKIFGEGTLQEVQTLINYLRNASQEMSDFGSRWGASRPIIPFTFDNFYANAHADFQKVDREARELQENISKMKFGVETTQNNKSVPSAQLSGGWVASDNERMAQLMEADFKKIGAIQKQTFNADSFKDFNRSAEEAAAKAKSIGDAFATFKTRSMKDVTSEIKSIQDALALIKPQVSAQEFSKFQKEASDRVKKLNQDLVGGKSAIGEFGDAFLKIAKYTTAFQLFSLLQQLPAQIYEANVKMESLSKSFEGAFGGATKGAEELSYAMTTADKYGKSIDSVANAYKRFAITAEYMGMTGSTTKKIFESVTQAITKVGGSSDDVNGTLTALIQMMSKGTVSSEEFRLQFAERIPGAMKMGADALGVTTAQFKKMMAEGQIDAADFIPKLATQLEKFSIGWEASSDTLVANTARMQNSLSKLLSSGVIQTTTNEFLKGAASAADFANNLAQKASTMASGKEMRNLGLLTDKDLEDMSKLDIDKFVSDYKSKTDEAKEAVLSAAQKDLENRIAELSSKGESTGTIESYFLRNSQELEKIQKNNYFVKLKEQIAEAQDQASKGLNVATNNQAVEYLAKLLGDLTKTDWRVYVRTEVDLGPIQQAFKTIDALFAKTKEGKAEAVAETVKARQKELDAINGKIEEFSKAPADSHNGPYLKQLTEHAEKAKVVLAEATGEYNSLVKAATKKQDGGMFDEWSKIKNTKAEDVTAKIGNADSDMWKDRTVALDRYKKALADGIATPQTLAEFKSAWSNIDQSRENAVRNAIEGHKKSGDAAAHHALAVEKLGMSVEAYMAKEFALADNDKLGAKFADIDKKAADLINRAQDLAIKGGVSIKEVTDQVNAAKEAAKDVAADDILAGLFPWIKKERSIETSLKAFEGHYEEMAQAAKRWGMEGEEAIAKATDKKRMDAFKAEVEKLKFTLENTFDLSKYGEAYTQLQLKNFAPSGDEEKSLLKDILNLYITSSATMAEAREAMYARVREAALATGATEKQADALVQAAREENTLKTLQGIEKTGSAYEAFAASFAESMGLYKSETTRSREAAVAFGKDASEGIHSIEDSISTGLTDALRGLITGTQTTQDAFKAMLDSMLDMLMSMIQKMIKYALENYVVIPIVQSVMGDSASDVISSLTGKSGSSSTKSSSGISSGSSSSTSSFSGSSDWMNDIKDLFGSKTSNNNVYNGGYSTHDGRSTLSTGWQGNSYSSPTGSSSVMGTIGGGLAGLGLGAGVSSLLGGNSTIGSIGGALGGAIGTAIAGPVGGIVGGLIGGIAGLFGNDKKEEKKKVASGYNVGYANGHATSYGVDFYNTGVEYSGPSDPDVQKKISDAFKDTAEALSDFAEELGFTVDVLEGFQMPNMNITSDQLDGYIRNGENMMAFKGLMEAGLRGAFDAVAEDGEVYVDEYKRLAESFSTVGGKMEAYGYDLANVAKITQDQIEALRVKNTEVAEGTAQAMASMAESMGATSDAVAQIASDTTAANAALSVTDEQLSNILEADYASKLLDAVGGEDAFNSIMDNLTKNIFSTVSAYAENLDYYTSKAQKAITKLGDSSVTVDNFWTKFDEAMKKGLTPDEFEAWGKASTWVNQINTVNDLIAEWDNSMTKFAQSLDARMQTAQGLDYQAALTQQLAAAEWELYDARKAGYDGALIARLQEVQAAELEATKRKHQTEYQNELLDAQSRIYDAKDDKYGAIEIQKQKNQIELADMARKFNWSPGSAEEPLFQALEKAMSLEIGNMYSAITDALVEATETLNNSLDVREAKLSGNDDLAEAIQMSNDAIKELSQAYEDGLDSETIARLISVQNQEMDAYLASIDSTLVSVEQTVSELLDSLLDQMNTLIDQQISGYQEEQQNAETLASSYENSAKSIYTTLENWAIESSGKTSDQTFTDISLVFDSFYKKAMSGDSDAFSSLSSYASSLKDAGLKKFGSYDEYQQFYRDLQEKMGAAAFKANELGDKQSDFAKLYQVQIDLYDLLKEELAKDDPNTALLAALGNTMSLVQEGIDTGNNTQEVIKNVTQNPEGTGGYASIIKALNSGNESVSNSIVALAISQTSLMSLLEQYLGASNRASLESKSSLAYTQYQQSKAQEVTTFRNSTLGNMLASLGNAKLSDSELLSTLLGYANGSGYGSDTGYSWYELLSNPNSTMANTGTHLTVDDFTKFYTSGSNGVGYNDGTYTRNWEWMYDQVMNNYGQYAFGNISNTNKKVLPSSIFSIQQSTASYLKKYQDYQAQLAALDAQTSSADTLSGSISFAADNGVATVAASGESTDVVAAIYSLKEEVAALRAESEQDNAALILLEQKMVKFFDKWDATSLNVTTVS